MTTARNRASWATIVALCVLPIATLAQAASLFATYRSTNGPVLDRLYEIDPETAAAREIAGLPQRLWSDLAARPGVASSIFAVSRIPGAEFRNTFSTIDVATGAVTDLLTWTAADLDLSPSVLPEFTGISVSRNDPTMARISLAVIDPSSTPSLLNFDFDLDLVSLNRTALRPVATLPGRTFTTATRSDDNTVFTLAQNATLGIELARLAEESVSIQLIGGCGSCLYRALDFDSDGGQLYAVDALGNLLLLSPLTGFPTATIGSTGLGYVSPGASVTGIAFVIPEPGASMLLGMGLVALSIRKR